MPRMTFASLFRSALIYACACLHPGGFGADTPPSPESLRSTTQVDLEAIANLVRAQTPIPFDNENPALRRWLVDGLVAARERAAKVRTAADAYYTLAAYVHGFGDPHVSLSPVGELPPARWPGFMVSMRDGKAVIVERDAGDPAAPPLGAAVSSCDGKSLATLAEELVFPFTLRRTLPGDVRRAMTRVFLDRNITFAPAPKSCSILVDGKGREFTLAWRALPQPTDAWWRAFANAANGGATAWGVSEPLPGITWIGVPTFSSSDDTSPKLQALIDAVDAKGDALRQGKAIVIDTRGNGGGNSYWADKLAVAIFTQDVIRAHPPPKRDSAVDWRASAENAAFWRTWADRMEKDFGRFSSQRRNAINTAERLEEALSKSPPLWRQGAANPGTAGGYSKLRPASTVPSPFPARVWVLSNGSCASSCLNFADRILFIPGVRLAGLATSADGKYMEVRSEILPSGTARFTLPQKVARGDGRAHMEFYAPDEAYDGAWNDASVRQWLLGLIQRDLAR